MSEVPESSKKRQKTVSTRNGTLAQKKKTKETHVSLPLFEQVRRKSCTADVKYVLNDHYI